MKTAYSKTKVIVAAAAVIFMASAAEAKITEMKFHVVTTQLDDVPYMEMVHDGSAYSWASESRNFNIRTKVLIKSVFNRFSAAGILVVRTNASLWKMPSHKTFKYESLDATTIGKAILSPFKNDAKALCDVFGGDKKVVRDMDIDLRMWVDYVSGPSVKGTLPVRVVCMPKKVPTRTPVAFKVSSVKLYTVPAKPVCGKPVRLVAEFHANKPGKASFVLQRRDGEQQGASIDIGQTASGAVKRWSKEYLYNSSIKREYQIIVPGHPILTPWVAVEVKCGAGVDVKRPGGFALPPRDPFQ